MTKEELLKKIDFEKSWLYDCGIFGSDVDIAFHAIKKKVIETFEKEQKWISVSDRLPKSCGVYIVTRKIYDCPDTAPIIMTDASWFDGKNTWHNDNRINHERRYLSDVIAWMPLPKPYKEGGTE